MATRNYTTTVCILWSLHTNSAITKPFPSLFILAQRYCICHFKSCNYSISDDKSYLFKIGVTFQALFCGVMSFAIISVYINQPHSPSLNSDLTPFTVFVLTSYHFALLIVPTHQRLKSSNHRLTKREVVLIINLMFVSASLFRELFHTTTGFWNSAVRPQSNVDYAVECWEHSIHHGIDMRNNHMSLNYFANQPKYTWHKTEHTPKVTQPPRYQPLCCALSGITKQTREAMTRLPEYILVGDPRHDIICRCVCHTSNIKECDSMLINGNRKLVIERPLPPQISRDIYIPFKPTRRNWSSNNNEALDVTSDQSRKASVAPVKPKLPVIYAPKVINRNNEVIRARWSTIALCLCFFSLFSFQLFIISFFLFRSYYIASGSLIFCLQWSPFLLLPCLLMGRGPASLLEISSLLCYNATTSLHPDSICNN